MLNWPGVSFAAGIPAGGRSAFFLSHRLHVLNKVPAMRLRDFLKAGHTPSLVCAFLYFDTSFMVWVLLGALANSIVPDFGLNEAQRGLMLAIPLLGGSLLRLVIGLLTDHIGARRTGIIGLTLTLVPL